MSSHSPCWPQGKRFAFTIVDDTDYSTVQNTKPIYDFLYENGFRITKTVWPLAPTERPMTGGDTLEDPEYCEWVLELQSRGMEIAYHGATDHSSPRERILEALEKFKAVLGDNPSVYASHTGQREAIYWGAARFDGLPRSIYRALNRLARRDDDYYGEIPGTPCFWGDYCRERVTYTRGFTFNDINTLNADPCMPYHDPRRPYVRFWFSGSDASGPAELASLLAPECQDRLMDEGGVCIAYSHLGKGFLPDGKLNRDFKTLLERLAKLPGWFVPATELLDHLRTVPGWCANANNEHLRRLQWMWLRKHIAPSQWKPTLKRVINSWRYGGERENPVRDKVWFYQDDLNI